MDLAENLFPFVLNKDDWLSTLHLDVRTGYKRKLFKAQANKYFIGSGYCWTALAVVFLEDTMPELINDINFDSNNNLFCVQSFNYDILKLFAISFKAACNNDTLLKYYLTEVKF